MYAFYCSPTNDSIYADIEKVYVQIFYKFIALVFTQNLSLIKTLLDTVADTDAIT